MSMWCLKRALLPPSGEKTTTTMNTALRTCNHTVNNALRALLTSFQDSRFKKMYCPLIQQ